MLQSNLCMHLTEKLAIGERAFLRKLLHDVRAQGGWRKEWQPGSKRFEADLPPGTGDQSAKW